MLTDSTSRLATAQRLGAAIGIAVIGTGLFGSGSSGGGAKIMPSVLHSGQTATAVNLCFTAALLCALGLPRRLAGQRDQQPRAEREEDATRAANRDGRPVDGTRAAWVRGG
jgi:hypothetical protein